MTFPLPGGRSTPFLAFFIGAVVATQAFPSADARTPGFKDPAFRLLGQQSMGTTLARIEKAAAKFGFEQQRITWKDNRALAQGLLEPPGLLQQLNQEKLRHPFFDGLPDQGPEFLLLKNEDTRMVFGAVSGKVWAVALSFKPVATEDSSPFDKARLRPIRERFRAMEELCRKLKVEKDSHGNPSVFRAKGCVRGNLIGYYDPTRADPLRILIYSTSLPAISGKQ